MAASTVRRRLGAGMVAGAGTTMLVLALAAAAPADVPGLHMVDRGSPRNSNPTNSATAECPDGETLLGLGGKSEGGNGHVVLDALAASTASGSVSGRSVTVRGAETPGNLTEWNVRAFAICAPDAGGATRSTINEPLSSVSPREISTVDNGGPCSGTANVLTGGGGQIPIGPRGLVMVDGVIPDLAAGGSTVRGIETGDGTIAGWSLRPYTVCSVPLEGLQRIERTSPLSSRDKHVTARCPGSQRVVGTGGEIVEGAGSGHVAITYMLPDDDLTRVHVRGAELAPEDGGTSAQWAVRAYALCADA